MSQHYKDIDGKIYGYKATETCTPISIEEVIELTKPGEAQLEEMALQQARLVRDEAMLTGATYNLNNEDYQISFTKEDGDGLVQVKSAFELGLIQTTIHFSNGTKLSISSSEFLEFALWFVNKRNEFFL